MAFTGDALFPAAAGAPYQLRHNLIYRNWVENDSHVRSLKTILDYEPTLVAPGHGKPFLANKADLEDLHDRLLQQQGYFHSVIADADCDFGLNPGWARLYPYQMEGRAGASLAVELRVRNYRSEPMPMEAALVLPAGWKAVPEVAAFTIPAKGDGSAGFTVTIPTGWDRDRPRVALAADVVADGQYLGEVAEGVVDVA